MGYNTKYSVTYDFENLSDEQIKEIDDCLIKELGIRDFETDWITWYDHTEDMIDISLKFPNVEFELWGRGEEADDLWREHFLNGVCQLVMAEITYKRPTWD
jgi:hypothetical protein